MESYQPNRIYRILALLAVVLNASFGYFYPRLPLGLEDMQTASSHYPALFTPAPYAFAIWGLIYVSWLFYTIYALLPSQRRNPLHDTLGKLLILVNVLASAWILEFTAGFVWVSVAVIVAMLLTGVALYARARRGTSSKRLLFPFSLFLGWITVATLANGAAALSSLDWHGGSWGEPAWTGALIGVAALAGCIVSWRYRDAVYVLVIAWATAAIGVRQLSRDPQITVTTVGAVAFAATALLVVMAAIAAVRSMRPAGYRPN